MLALLERITPNIVYRVRTHLPLVALSFDDGPHPTFAPQVLEILERQDAKATFFLIGERVLRHPEIVARLRLEGTRLETITSGTLRPLATLTPSLFATWNRPKARSAALKG